MSYFKAKCIKFKSGGWGSATDPAVRAYNVLPNFWLDRRSLLLTKQKENGRENEKDIREGENFVQIDD